MSRTVPASPLSYTAAVRAAQHELARDPRARLGAALRDLAEDLARERERSAALRRELDRAQRELEAGAGTAAR